MAGKFTNKTLSLCGFDRCYLSLSKRTLYVKSKKVRFRFILKNEPLWIFYFSEIPICRNRYEIKKCPICLLNNCSSVLYGRDCKGVHLLAIYMEYIKNKNLYECIPGVGGYPKVLYKNNTLLDELDVSILEYFGCFIDPK